VIYQAARGLATGDHSYSYYFEDYPNNIGVTLLLSGVFQFADSLGFHNPQLVGLLFNIRTRFRCLWSSGLYIFI
jgi:hypothetical protein